MSSGATVDFAQKTDPWSLLIVMILMTVMEKTYKTGTV
jgi:hypothetical protein